LVQFFVLTRVHLGQLLGYEVQCAVAAAALACSPASAGSCNKDVTAAIQMRAGQICWSYRGAATSFIGGFKGGQAVSAQMTGVATEYDPRSGRVASVLRPRDPNVEGPGGFFFGAPQAPGLLTFVAPANGTYRFSFSPCAMWGAPGTVTICTH
jgi:hypothetical protein